MKVSDRAFIFIVMMTIFAVLLLFVFGFIYGVSQVFGINIDMGIIGLVTLILIIILVTAITAQEELASFASVIIVFIVLLVIFNAITQNLLISFILSLIFTLIFIVYVMTKFLGV